MIVYFRSVHALSQFEYYIYTRTYAYIHGMDVKIEREAPVIYI
jgi:hypothetical protein